MQSILNIQKTRSLPEEMMCFVVKSGKVNLMTLRAIVNYPIGVSIHMST